MAPPASLSDSAHVVQVGKDFCINSYDIKVISYRGQLTAQVWYFDVSFRAVSEEGSGPFQAGLLRVGAADTENGLSREIAIRKALDNYQMIAPALVQVQEEAIVLTDSAATSNSVRTEESSKQENNSEEDEVKSDFPQPRPVTVEIASSIVEFIEPVEIEPVEDISRDSQNTFDEADTINSDILDGDTFSDMEIIEGNSVKDDEAMENNEYEQPSEDSPFEAEDPREECPEGGYLEEEYYEEENITDHSAGLKLIVLSACADNAQTLSSWMEDTHSLEENLSILIQICQFFRYLHQRNWCFAHLLPECIQLSKPIQFHDLTGAYTVGNTLPFGLQGPYCAPELGYEKAVVQESLSSYTIGALLYQFTYGKSLDFTQTEEPEMTPIPRISQLLKICLADVPEERFPLNQLLQILLGARQALRAGTFTWQTAHRSTVGLSTARLQNEDSYGVRQQQLGNSQSMVMGIVADGMGGMTEGDVASSLAVKTCLEEPVPAEPTADANYATWLEGLVKKANDVIAASVREGGTTLSVVFAVNKILTLAHVGDSRIYLVRNKTLCQVSEDHSLVAMMVASGEITPKESLEHPERNVLIKSLGSKRPHMEGYIQTMAHWGDLASMELRDEDVLLLCSDGVWDLVSDTELCESFISDRSIQQSVDSVIEKVLVRGAGDNATLLALKLTHDTRRPD